MKKFSQKLAEHYESEIRESNWEKIQANAYANPQYDENGEVVFQDLLGSVTYVLPSGKIYAPWTTNQTGRDMIRDRCYMGALEKVAEEHDMTITEYSGDLFATIYAGACIFRTENTGFWFNGEHICDTDEDLEAWMEQEGNFPDVFHDDGRGSLFYYSVGSN